MKNLDSKFPPLKGFHWAFYLALFIAILAVLCKLWEKSQKYVINAVVGLILLLLLIHVLGVELRITLLSLILASLFGIPGVIFIVAMHYLGVVI
ncbi:MAG: pro-sigmaK processing inhibitor BofA family protein [Candidatus Altiarchaeota archaeon]|nr:pro-sigmaK processing inhibitor BofA family protein [Candidatus Altiarchaeota archaeon]